MESQFRAIIALILKELHYPAIEEEAFDLLVKYMQYNLRQCKQFVSKEFQKQAQKQVPQDTSSQSDLLMTCLLKYLQQSGSSLATLKKFEQIRQIVPGLKDLHSKQRKNASVQFSVHKSDNHFVSPMSVKHIESHFINDEDE